MEKTDDAALYGPPTPEDSVTGKIVRHILRDAFADLDSGLRRLEGIAAYSPVRRETIDAIASAMIEVASLAGIIVTRKPLADVLKRRDTKPEDVDRY